MDCAPAKVGSVFLRCCFNCFNGHYLYFLQLHCFLLLNCFNGSASDLVCRPCFYGRLRIIKEEGSSQSRPSQPLCSRRLGDGNFIPCSIGFVSRHNRVVLWRLGRLYARGGMHEVPDCSCISFFGLDKYCYFFSHHALASCIRLAFVDCLIENCKKIVDL